MRIFYSSILALVLVVVGYYFWWNYLADRMLVEAEKWRAARIAEGYEISHKPLYASGFPYRVAITAEELTISNPGNDYKPRLEVTRFWAITQPWRFNHVIYGTDNSGKLSWEEKGALREMPFTAASILGSATFNRQGRIRTAALDIKGLEAVPDWRPPISAERLQLHGRPKPVADGDKAASPDPGQQIVLRIDNLLINGMEDFPLGSRIESFDLSTTLHGTIRRLPAADTLHEWRSNGGYVDIDALHLDWGPGTIDGDGRLALDALLRPEGIIDTRITGYREILAALITAGRIDPDAGRTISFAIDLLAREDENGRRYIGLPLTADNGGLYLGPVYLLSLRPVAGNN